MTQTVRLILTLTIAWVLLSGMFKTQFIVLGILSVALTTWLALHMRVLTHRGEPIYFRFLAIVGYWVWLARQIFASNLDVARRVWMKDIDITPTLRRSEPSPQTEVGRVIYANSITLTPGTTAINFTPDGDVVVHALHEEGLKELERGEMARRVMATEPTVAEPPDRED